MKSQALKKTLFATTVIPGDHKRLIAEGYLQPGTLVTELDRWVDEDGDSHVLFRATDRLGISSRERADAIEFDEALTDEGGER